MYNALGGTFPPGFLSSRLKRLVHPGKDIVSPPDTSGNIYYVSPCHNTTRCGNDSHASPVLRLCCYFSRRFWKWTLVRHSLSPGLSGWPERNDTFLWRTLHGRVSRTAYATGSGSNREKTCIDRLVQRGWTALLLPTYWATIVVSRQ